MKDNEMADMLQSGFSAGESIYSLMLEQFYPFIIVAKLQASSYSIVNGTTFFKTALSEEGQYDDLLEYIASTLQPEYRGRFIGKFARANLFTSYARQEKSISLDATCYSDDGVYHWIRLGLIFLGTGESDGDIRFVLYFRLIDDEKRQEIDAANLKRVFGMVVPEAFDYIALIDVANGMFEMFSDTIKGQFGLPLMGDYETLISLVRDEAVPASQHEDFIKATEISKLQLSLKSIGDVFRYKCEFRAGEEYEMSFRLFNMEKTQILMAIRKK